MIYKTIVTSNGYGSSLIFSREKVTQWQNQQGLTVDCGNKN